MPKSHTEYWQPKLANNVLRDRAVRRLLKRQGWRVHRIWEHELRKPDIVAHRLRVALGRAQRQQ